MAAPPPSEPPQAVITLKKTKDGIGTLWVTETPELVNEMVGVRANDMSVNPLVLLHRWTVKDVTEFRTRYDNILNVEVYQ